MKKVLFISYYWPPAGGAPVQRILKFYQYLPEFGWEPYVLTTQDGDFPFVDESLSKLVRPETQITRSKGFSLHKIFSKLSPKSKKNFVPYGFTDNSKNSFMDNFSRLVKYNFIPDTRYPWRFGTVRKAVRIIKKEKIDLIFSSSPPQTNHIIARKAARRTGIPWVADFRDPWTDVFWVIDKNTKRWKWIHKIDKRIERKTIARMDEVITVGPSLVEMLQRKTSKQIHEINNGFDDAYFSSSDYKPNAKFRITYAGSISKEQDPKCFFDAMEKLMQKSDFAENTELSFLGNFPTYLHDLAKSSSFSEKISFSPYTHFEASLEFIAMSEMLLMMVPRTADNKCIITSKLFDYMGSRRPILAFGPVDGDASIVLNRTNAGKLFDYNDVDGAAAFIGEMFEKWKNGEQTGNNSDEINAFTRRNLTEQLSKVFEKAIKKNPIL